MMWNELFDQLHSVENFGRKCDEKMFWDIHFEIWPFLNYYFSSNKTEFRSDENRIFMN